MPGTPSDQVVIAGAAVLARIDLGHGAEIADLVDVASGRPLLARPPFASLPALGGDLDEETWTARYRGGWQLCAPNVGAPCRVGDAEHGFHGRASNDPWRLLDRGESWLAAAWEGHGLAVERRFTAADALVIETTVRATSAAAPFAALEHVALGVELLEPDVHIRVPAGLAYELSETEGPPTPPPDACRWPEVRLFDGAVERADTWSIDRPRSRLVAIADLPDGSVEVVNGRTGQGVAVTWDADVLPHVWLWHEVRGYGGPWRRQTELLAVEPSSSPHPLGLATAIEHGQALQARPGEEVAWSIRLRPFG